MKDPKDIAAKLIGIVEPVCESAGYELVDLYYGRGPQGWVVRVYIDYLEGEGSISFEDCEGLSRELGAVLDVEDPVPHAYSLEVSSPGVDRPLRKPEHFRRFLGQEARVSLKQAREGRKNFQGVLVEAEPETVSIEVDGQTYRLPLSEVASAKLVPDWDAILSGKR